ncbi:uncharacterized protein N7515_003736 [Penicillium bovifimosum]|uniref:Uncharacterized protein n=1 Tax=Penicillium bovifimosum TaxID=126998 RepID=A0A9W9H5E4_9EURO|nr:uncharacterized protein N7515_003736 [Penicillium bovifimosum]KAJ5138888.1 hypothetical protein N7515_003736 [Penicillium bovifimosum]
MNDAVISSLLQKNTRAEELREGEDNWPGAIIVPLRLQQQTTTVGGVPDRDRLLTLTNPLKLLRGSGERDSRDSQLPEAEDDMVANAASFTFLQRVSQLTPSPFEWVFNRLLFHPQFALGGYETFTDGALRCRTRLDHIFAILEVKRRDRHTSYAEMVMQETCELVGWLLKSSSSIACFNGHSLMISQGRDGLFLTFKPFNEAHQRYLAGEGWAEDFLRMETFGPFKTNNDRDMTLFGSVKLAAIEIAVNRALD